VANLYLALASVGFSYHNITSRQTRASKEVRQMKSTRSITQKGRAAESVDDRVRKVSRMSKTDGEIHQFSDEVVNEDFQSLIKKLTMFKMQDDP